MEIKEFIKHILNLINHRNKFKNIDDILIDENALINNIKKEYIDYLKYKLNELFEEISFFIQQIFENINSFKTADINNFNKNISNFNNILLDLKNRLNEPNFENIDLTRLTSIMFLGKGTFANKLITLSESIGLTSKFSKKYKEILDSYQESIEGLNNNEDLLLEQINDIKLLVSIANEINTKVEEFKSNENLIDFDNILYLANKLLDNEKILNEIQSEIKLLMVDEFQDTSDVQFDIVKKIVGDGNLDKIKLIIVGDEKQSIYAFRNAEIRVFKESREFIKEINNNQIINGKIKRDFKYAEITAIDEEQEGIISLNTSYRFLPHLSAFVNLTNSSSFEYFKDNLDYIYFNETINQNATKYDEFIYGLKAIEKEREILKPDSEKINELIQNNPIEFITFLKENESDETSEYSNSNDNENDETIENGEIKLVALKIFDLIKNGTKAGDIGVISHTQKAFYALSEQLNSLNIQNINHGRNEFFISREIKDIYTYLKFLISPDYDINLAALLKSYFFLFSDEDLLELSIISDKSDNNISLFKKLELSKLRNNQKYVAAFDFLENALNNHLIYDFNGILELIFDNSLWHQTIKHINKEDIINNNIKLFKNAIDEFQKNTSKHLTDIVDYIFETIHIENNSNFKTEAQIDKDKVNLLTIHASKGLDFDTLIVMNMGNQHKNFILDGNYSNKYGYVFKSKNKKVKDVKIILNELATIEGKIIQIAEKIRLLYVAMTRVKSKLILSSTLKISKKGEVSYAHNSFFSYLKDFVDEKINISNIEENGKEYIFNNILKYPENNILNDVNIKYSVIKNYYKVGDLEDKYNTIEIPEYESKNEEKIFLTKHIPIRISKEDFTATKFKNINVYQSEYFKRYILNVPDNMFAKINDFSDFDGRKVIDSAKKGNIVHSLMENMITWLNDNLEVNIDKLNELIEYNRAFYEFNDDVGNYFYDVCNNLASSSYLKNYQSKMSLFQHELGLKMPLGNSFLSCVIDLCFKDGNTLEIWDWKTDIITGDNELNEKIASYQYQLKTYAYISYYYFNKPVKIIAKLIFLDKLKENDTTMEWVKEFIWTEQEILSFESELKTSLLKANKMNFGIV
jgi:ATP-dependent helicase/nuclease subunit A